MRLIYYVCSSARNWVSSMYKDIDQFLLGSSDPGCLKFLNWNIKKTSITRNDKFIFILFKNMSFSSSPKVTPTTGVVEQWKKKYFAMNTNGIRWCSSKRWWIFPLKLIFYVCNSARNWVSSMYKGIDQFPLGSSNLDVWSSWIGTWKKTPGHPKWWIYFCFVKKNEFFKLN